MTYLLTCPLHGKGVEKGGKEREGGREGTGIKEGKGGDWEPLHGKRVERGGEEGKRRRNGPFLLRFPSSPPLSEWGCFVS